MALKLGRRDEFRQQHNLHTHTHIHTHTHLHTHLLAGTAGLTSR